MEVLNELTEAELDKVSGGAAAASFTFSNTASGTIAAVTGSLFQFTTSSSAVQNGRFDSASL